MQESMSLKYAGPTSRYQIVHFADPPPKEEERNNSRALSPNDSPGIEPETSRMLKVGPLQPTPYTLHLHPTLHTLHPTPHSLHSPNHSANTPQPPPTPKTLCGGGTHGGGAGSLLPLRMTRVAKHAFLLYRRLFRRHPLIFFSGHATKYMTVE